MAVITDYENEQIKQANASGKTPIVFVHGLDKLVLEPLQRRVSRHYATT